MLTLWYLSLNSVFPLPSGCFLTDSVEADTASVQRCCRVTVWCQKAIPARWGEGRGQVLGKLCAFGATHKAGKDRNDGILQASHHESASLPPPTPTRVTAPKSHWSYTGAVPLPLSKPTGSISAQPRDFSPPGETWELRWEPSNPCA